MKTIAQIRLDNLELLINEIGTAEKVAAKSDTSAVYLSQLRHQTPDSKTGKSREMGSPTARSLERGCDKPLGWMDNPQGEPSYRDGQIQQAVRAMEDMPQWQFEKAVQIIKTLAAPPADSPPLARLDYTDPATYQKSSALGAAPKFKTPKKQA